MNEEEKMEWLEQLAKKIKFKIGLIILILIFTALLYDYLN